MKYVTWHLGSGWRALLLGRDFAKIFFSGRILLSHTPTIGNPCYYSFSQDCNKEMKTLKLFEKKINESNHLQSIEKANE